MTVIDATERLERLDRVLEELYNENQHAPILVEGKRDVDALRNLGMDGEILMVHEGHTIMEMCETIGAHHDEVILLLDWDKKGKALTERIRRNLISSGIKVNDSIRARIFSLVAKETKEVEALDAFYARLSTSVFGRRIRPFPAKDNLEPTTTKLQDQ